MKMRALEGRPARSYQVRAISLAPIDVFAMPYGVLRTIAAKVSRLSTQPSRSHVRCLPACRDTTMHHPMLGQTDLVWCFRWQLLSKAFAAHGHPLTKTLLSTEAGNRIGRGTVPRFGRLVQYFQYYHRSGFIHGLDVLRFALARDPYSVIALAYQLL